MTDLPSEAAGAIEAAAPLEPAMICMSVIENGPRIAFAAYNEEFNQIMIEESYANGYETQGIVERVLNCVRPTLLLLSNKIVGNEALLEILTTPPPDPREGIDDNDDDGNESIAQQSTAHQQADDQHPRSIPYRLMKSASFELRNCRGMLMKLRVKSLLSPESNPTAQGQGRRFPLAPSGQSFRVSNYHGLASIVDFESNVQVQALGGLLSFLESTIFSLEPGGIITVDDVVRTNASMYMNLSQDTLSALNIFSTERHPLAAACGRGNAKEGMSLFSLLDRTKSHAGRQRLRDWMLKPLQDVEAISARQDGVELFMLQEMQSPAASLLEHLGQIGPIDKILGRMQKCCAKPNDFLVLIKTLSASLSIFTTLQQEVLWVLQQRSQISQTPQQQVDQYQEEEWQEDDSVSQYIAFVQSMLQECHFGVVEELLDRVVAVIDENATAVNRTVVVRRGFNEVLDFRKEQYDNLGETLRDVADELSKRLPCLGSVLSAIFMPQVGFLVALKHHSSWAQSNAVPEDFDLIFGKDGTSYYKNPDMRNLDESFGDIDSFIKDTEALIVAELEDVILDRDYELRAVFNALADLDCILSFSSFCADNRYVRPMVVPSEEKCIRIKNGRHPLQELLCESKFVPNDANMDTKDRINIVTGPNFSGKSCYARQIGVLTYMAHIGCFLPCDGAQISVVDRILARFSSAESCAVPQSSFQFDLTKMGSILRKAGQKSLVIIDEFGKGTSPSSGIALLTSALQSLAAKGCMVVCTTHFLEVFSMGLLKDGENGTRALSMSIHVPERADDHAIPLFKLELGVANSSAGVVCAKMAGVKKTVIDRAYEIVEATKERRRVQPLMEIWRRHLTVSSGAKQLLGNFIGGDLTGASDEDIEIFLSNINRSTRRSS